MKLKPFRADGSDIGTGRIREIADNSYGDEEKCWLAKRVLALQAQLEESEQFRLKFQDANCELCQKLEAAEKRIAELNQLSSALTMKIEPMDRRIAELEQSELQLIEERDNAEYALAEMYQAATGERPEWSNMFGFAEAVDAVEERLASLESAQMQPVMFIDGDISSSDADKLAAVIREFNEETETPAARMARIIRENPHPTNMCDMPAAEKKILYRERNPYNGLTTGWEELTEQEYEIVKDNASKHAEFRTVYTAPPVPEVPAELHPDTQKLVIDFCTALAEKLYKAQLKYGYDADWKQDGWPTQCQAHFHQHIAKGDPRDVAAYCAFMWYHGWKTESEPAPVSVPGDVMAAIQKVARIRLDLNGFDGDRRGIAESLGEAEEALIEVVNRRAAMLQGGNGVTNGKPLTITLPDISSKAFWSGTGKNETFHPETYRRWVKEAIERSCIIASVDVEVK